MIKINGVYKHFKGEKYRVISVAKHSETQEKLVVYAPLNDPENVWARPFDMFADTVQKDGKEFHRFEEVKANKPWSKLFRIFGRS